MSTQEDSFPWVLAAIVATVLLVLIAALFQTGQSNAEKQQEFKLACIQAGGSFVKDSCITPRVVPSKETPPA